MKKISAENLGYRELNNALHECHCDATVTDCLGQRFIAAGKAHYNYVIEGISGNALGAYLNGSVIRVNGNAQDAVGDTMNAGQIFINGNVGDAVGYAMRGGEIYVKGNAGYRAGIHMKAYKEKKPIMVIGGKAGSFLGEYQAGGLIVVLGLSDNNKPIVGNFPCTGMHGGKMFLRTKPESVDFSGRVNVNKAEKEDLEEIKPYISNFCKEFGYDEKEILNSEFTLVTPDTKNPYKQMYVAN